MTAFAASMASATLSELAAVLGDDIAPIQVEWLLHMEAEDSGTLEAFARDLLVRTLRERLPNGWKAGDSFKSQLAGAFAAWETSVGEALLSERHCAAMWSELQTLRMPEGWLPSGPDDPVIAHLFDTHQPR